MYASRFSVVGTTSVSDLESVAIRQPHVGQTQIVCVLRKQLVRFRGGCSAVGIKPHARECEYQELPDVGLVVDDEYLAVHAHLMKP